MSQKNREPNGKLRFSLVWSRANRKSGARGKESEWQDEKDGKESTDEGGPP